LARFTGFDFSDTGIAAARLDAERRGLANARGDSGYEQAEAELCRIEGDELAVALGPPA
jgi:hypothetical protein